MLNGLEDLSQYLTYVGLVGATSAGVAYFMFKTFSEKWLDQKFSKGLEAFRHSQAIEIAKLQLQHDAILERFGRENQKRFEVLPRLWEMLVKAHVAGKASIGSFHSVPDFERIAKSDYDAFLKIENFSFFETMYINDSVDKSKAYSRIMLYRSVSRAQETLFSASDFLEQNAVFIEPDLLKKVRDFIALLRSVWAERQTALDAPSVGFKEWQKLDKEGAKVMSEIETEVRAALGSQILKA